MTTQRVYLQPHDPMWAEKFTRESSMIRDALGDVLIAIHHIGSTAIPGICAKPIIDMLAEVSDLFLLDERSSVLAGKGYEVMGEFGIPGRRYFRKNDPTGERTHQVHAFQIGSPQIARHLEFRDYLIAHPVCAREYEDLKQRLAALYPRDIASYSDGKDGFIAGVDARAAAWCSSSQ